MRLAIVSDTHVPSRADAIPEWVADEVRSADHTIHAGDFDSREALDRVETLAGGELTAVAGNMDRANLGLPEVATHRAGGVTFVVVHGTGGRVGYVDRVHDAVRERAADVDGTVVGVCGHTHEYMDDVVGGVRLLNPGSATGAAPAEETTMVTATVEGGEVDATLRRRDE
jgi:hypothetical protein